MPDFTRYAKDQKAQMLGQTLGLPTTMTFFAGMGVIITSASEKIYGQAIWDPTELVAKPDFGHPVIVLLSLITIGVATLSVNVAANVVSPAFDFANLWPSKIDFKRGGTITGILGILIQPWNLMSGSGTYIFTWLVGYSGLLGPLAGIMVCDYWILRKTRLAVDELYQEEGRYTFYKGFNPWAFVALVAGVVPNIPGFLVQLQASEKGIAVDQVLAQYSGATLSFYKFSTDIYSFAWMAGFAISFGLYLALMKGPGAAYLQQDAEENEDGQRAVGVSRV